MNKYISREKKSFKGNDMGKNKGRCSGRKGSLFAIVWAKLKHPYPER